MNVWHTSSSERKPCVVCGKKTGQYKVYEQNHMSIYIPLCDYSHVGMENRDCYRKVDIKKYAISVLTEIKRQVLEQAKGVEV